MFNLDEELTSLKTLATRDIYDNLSCASSLEEVRLEHLNTEDKNGPTTFLPLNTNIGGQSKPNRSRENKYLTDKQAKHMYKKVELGTITDINTIKQEIDQD